MRPLLLLVLTLLPALAFAVPPANVAQRRAAPEIAVLNFYRDHAAATTPLIGAKGRGRLDRYFTRELADLMLADVRRAGDEVGVLDGDPLYDAQDFEIAQLKVRKPEKVEGGLAEVLVTFTNFGEPRRLLLTLRSSGPRWRIDDIRYEDGRSLRDLLGEP